MILHLPSPTRFSHWASAKDGGKFMADPQGSIGGCMASCACCNLRGKFLQKTCQGQNIVFLGGGMVIRPSMGIQGNPCIDSYIHGLIWMITENWPTFRSPELGFGMSLCYCKKLNSWVFCFFKLCKSLGSTQVILSVSTSFDAKLPFLLHLELCDPVPSNVHLVNGAVMCEVMGHVFYLSYLPLICFFLCIHICILVRTNVPSISISPSLHLSISSSLHLSIHPSVHPSACLSACLSVYLLSYLPTLPYPTLPYPTLPCLPARLDTNLWSILSQPVSPYFSYPSCLSTSLGSLLSYPTLPCLPACLDTNLWSILSQPVSPYFSYPSCLSTSLGSLLLSLIYTGGGSFKNRKPIGEVRCCESGMAERIHWWTERCLRSPLFRSLSLTIYLPTYLSSIYLSIDLSISLSLSFVYLSTCLPVYLSIYLSVCLSVYLCTCLSVVQCHSV